MQKLIVVFVFIWIIIAGKAQIIIQGKVLDNNSGLPVANASVYLNNTTYGTNTNNEGGFLLSVGSIFTGELIVSSAGHEPLYYKLNSNDADKKLYVFKLEVKEKMLNGVLIVNNATRQIWLKLFKENFLGITEEAENCTIENLDAIYFTAEENIIYAYADTALIITNKLLGYNIAFDLVEFYFDINKRSAYCIGFTIYGEMEGSKKYIKRRKQNYYGSTKHFYRSLINKELDAEGFSMFKIKKLIDDKDSGKNDRIPISDEEPILAMPIDAINILFIDNISNEY